jgi:hypothetical protein
MDVIGSKDMFFADDSPNKPIWKDFDWRTLPRTTLTR